ncbi:MAG: sigma-70 family RNA polymerase sigma factor, partial [Armatimonadota bacterium]|nr:sigma-70 family RNA polymerase sigma factor [Armatimonadota bacterium]
TRSGAGQQTLPAAETLLPLVRGIARGVAQALPPSVEVDDLVHDGVVGLLEAIGRFDPSRGVDFSTYATYRIRGAILDGLRGRDPLPRSLRRQLGAAPRASAPLAVVPLKVVPLDAALVLAGDDGQPEEALLAEELRAEVERALRALPPRHRRLLALRFGRGLRLREVAACFGISMTRAAELQERAIRRLRTALAVEHPDGLSPNGKPRRRRPAANAAPSVPPGEPATVSR